MDTNGTSPRVTDEDLSGKKVAVVEDDKELNAIMQKWLTRAKAEVLSAVQGQEGLTMIRKEKPDIILLDILLPDMNGFDVLRSLKSDQEVKDVPVILFSNLSYEKDIQQGYDLGAARFLVKSTVLLDNIVKEIRNVLREHGQL